MTPKLESEVRFKFLTPTHEAKKSNVYVCLFLVVVCVAPRHTMIQTNNKTKHFLRCLIRRSILQKPPQVKYHGESFVLQTFSYYDSRFHDHVPNGTG